MKQHPMIDNNPNEYGMFTTGLGDNEITIVRVLLPNRQDEGLFDLDDPELDDYPEIRAAGLDELDRVNGRKAERWRDRGRNN